MTERIKFGLKEGLPVESGRHDTSANFQAVCWSRLPLFCIAGLVSVGLAHSALAQPVSANVDAGYAVSSGGTMSALAAKNPENDQLPWETQALENKTELKPMPNPSIGVEIIGGLALFIWIQRFRNYSV